MHESYKANTTENINGRQNWLKIVDFLRETVILKDKPNPNQIHNNKLIKLFENSIRYLFEAWWEKQAMPTGKNKLDFYYTFKRSYKYETYLDYLPRHLRTHVTRFRISNHCLPIEVMRYNKNKKSARKESVMYAD